MFGNLDTTHSYDPIALLRFIYRLFFGGASNATDWASRTHESLSAFFNALPFYLINIFAKYAVFSIFLSLVLFILLIIYVQREKEIKRKIIGKILPQEGEHDEKTEYVLDENPKWKIVEDHISSEDASKWKLAIIESDIILSELLESMHLPGEGVGEKLKAIEKSDFDHIEEAWEAHNFAPSAPKHRHR